MRDVQLAKLREQQYTPKCQERWADRGKAYMAKPVNGSGHPDRKEEPERQGILTV